jgi:hypothetical protein
MPKLPLKDAVKVRALIARIQSGAFDGNDIDSLLIKLRPYSGDRRVFREISDFVAHADARNKGVVCDSMIAFADFMRYFQEYYAQKKSVNLADPFPFYILRLFRSQTEMANDDVLKSQFKMGRQSLLKKIDGNFVLDKKTKLCTLREGKGGKEFLEAILYVCGTLHAKPAFHIDEFNLQLKAVIVDSGFEINDADFDAQMHKIDLALLCLVSGTKFSLPEGDTAECVLSSGEQMRLIEGRWHYAGGKVEEAPTEFGTLKINASIAIRSTVPGPRVNYTVIETNLQPCDWCDASLFKMVSDINEFGPVEVEFLNFDSNMAMNDEFKIVRAIDA